MGILGFEFMRGHVRTVGVVTALSVASLVAGCGDSSAGPTSPYPEADAQGVDGFALAGAVERFSAVEGMRSFIMSRNGVVLAEEYFNETGPDDPHDVRLGDALRGFRRTAPLGAVGRDRASVAP